MLNLWGPAAGKIDRREMLRVGSLALPGLTLPGLIGQASAAPSAKSAAARGKSFGKAKNCIMLYLSGGPSHIDMWDPKPDAADDIRGEFKTVQTSLTGCHWTELLPHSSKWVHKIAQVRSMQHEHNDHGRGSYWMFTGYMYPGSVPDNNNMNRQDMPHMGAVLAKLAPGKGPMFPWALVPHRMDVAGGRRAGQFAGNLGPKYDPLLPGGNPNDDNFRLEHLPLNPNEQPAVFQRRMSLLDQLNAQAADLQKLAVSQSIRDNQAKALDVIASDQVRRAVDLSRVDKDERERYGRNLFGQSTLLGRRLLESGARLVQINWQRTQGINGFAWDTHWNNFSAHKDDLVPPFDKAYAALLADLEKTGQLDDTLVIVAAEFGRSPKITRSNTGREHWPSVYTVLFAGAGIQKGVIHGASDKIGGYPATSPTTPADFTATVYHLLGIDPHGEMHDQVNRPFQISKGNPIAPILI